MPLVTKNWRWKEATPAASCARDSFRTKKIGDTVLIRVCCPKGKWNEAKERCAGSMKQVAVGKKRKSE